MPQAVFFGVAAEEERRPRERRVRRGSSSRGQIQGGDRRREGSAFLSRGNHNRFPEPRTVKNPQKTRPSSRHGPQNHPQESEKNRSSRIKTYGDGEGLGPTTYETRIDISRAEIESAS